MNVLSCSLLFFLKHGSMWFIMWLCYRVVYLICVTFFFVIYNVKVLSLSWYADSCSPYNIFINVYMIIYIWKGSISVNKTVVSWMGIHHFHRKQVYTFNVFAIHLITLSKPSTHILTKAISSSVRLQVIQVFTIIVITSYR